MEMCNSPGASSGIANNGNRMLAAGAASAVPAANPWLMPSPSDPLMMMLSASAAAAAGAGYGQFPYIPAGDPACGVLQSASAAAATAGTAGMKEPITLKGAVMHPPNPRNLIN